MTRHPRLPLLLVAGVLFGLLPGTPASAAASLTVAVIGDYGCQPGSTCAAAGAHEIAVANLVHSWSPDAIVTVGDNSYEDGGAASVGPDQRPYAVDIAAGSFYPTPGNHDWLNGTIAPSTALFHRPPHYVAHLGNGLLDLFVTDMNGQDPDGDSAASRQAGQYLADVTASKATWKITTDHQAFYSSGEHGSYSYTHWAIQPQIDLFLSGHDHDFEHLVEGGKTFVVDGVGGRNLYPVCRPACVQGSVWHDDQDFGAVRLRLTATAISVELIKVGGQVLHAFQLSKGAGAGPVNVTPAPDQRGTGNGGQDQPLPIRAAFYYPWFPEAWSQQGMDTFARYQPSAGFYDSSDPKVIKKHIAAMRYGGIQAGIASWWGRGSPTDERVPALLSAAEGTPFRWALLYEPEGQGNPSRAQIDSDLRYISDTYANDPAYLRVNGRFVVFVYASAGDGCGMAARWQGASQLGAYVLLKIFPGYQKCGNRPDGWYQYSGDVAKVSVSNYSYSISPGFWKASEPNARLTRDVERWKADVSAMLASNAPFQLITTFNEWGEGTSIESAGVWASRSGYGQYLDVLHELTGASADLPARPAAAAAPRRPGDFPAWAIWTTLAFLALVLVLALFRWRAPLAALRRRIPGRHRRSGGMEQPVR